MIKNIPGLNYIADEPSKYERSGFKRSGPGDGTPETPKSLDL